MIPSVLEEAAAYYAQNGGEFIRDADFCTRFGIFYADFQTVFMARPCLESNPWQYCFSGNADAWYVAYVYGHGMADNKLSMRKGISMMMQSIPSITRVGFTRTEHKSEVRFYDIDKLWRKVNGISKT